MATLAQIVGLIFGSCFGIFVALLMAKQQQRARPRRRRREETDLDDWDSQDQLEGDQV